MTQGNTRKKEQKKDILKIKSKEKLKIKTGEIKMNKFWQKYNIGDYNNVEIQYCRKYNNGKMKG